MTPAVPSCPCLPGRRLPSLSTLFSPVILGPLRQVGERPSIAADGLQRAGEPNSRPWPRISSVLLAKGSCSCGRSLSRKMLLAGSKSLVLLCLINLLCHLLRASGDETPAACPPCVSARSVITQAGPRAPQTPGTPHASCVKAFKACKHQIRHLTASEEWKGFPPPWPVFQHRHLAPMAASEVAGQCVPSSLLEEATQNTPHFSPVPYKPHGSYPCPPSPDPVTGATGGEGHKIGGKQQRAGHRTQLQSGNPARLVREGSRDGASPRQVLWDTQRSAS